MAWKKLNLNFLVQFRTSSPKYFSFPPIAQDIFLIPHTPEAWGMRSAERRKVNVLEMKCLSLVAVSRMDRVMNEEVRRRAGIERELTSRANQRVLRWFGHVERMDEYRMARRALMAKVSGRWVRRRPRLGWMDGVKVALGNRRVTVEAALAMRKRPERVESPGTYVTEWVSLGHFCLTLCSFGPPSHALAVITLRGEGCRYMIRLG